MNADLRGFRYPLATAVQVREWRVDRLMRRLVRARTALANLERSQAELDETGRLQVSATRDAWAMTADPAARGQMLGFLSLLRARQAALRAEHTTAVADIETLKQAVKDEQIGLRALEEHRSGQRELFSSAQRQSEAAAADTRWMIIAAWQARSTRGNAR